MLASVHRYLCRAQLEGGRLETALQPCIDAAVVQEKTVEGKPSATVFLGNLGSAYTYAARAHRGLTERVISMEERQQHLQEALSWYNKAVAVLNDVKRQYGDRYESILFEVHPDSLAAERDAFVQEMGL